MKPVPVIVTAAPTAPGDPVNEDTVRTLKFDPDVPVPFGVVTVIVPVVAATGTVVVIDKSLTTVNVGWLVPLNLTAVAPVKPLPVIVTAAPIGPGEPVNDVMTGTGNATSTTTPLQCPDETALVAPMVVVPALVE